MTAALVMGLAAAAWIANQSATSAQGLQSEAPRASAEKPKPKDAPPSPGPQLGQLRVTAPGKPHELVSGESFEVTFVPDKGIEVGRLLVVCNLPQTVLVEAPPWKATLQIPKEFVGTAHVTGFVTRKGDKLPSGSTSPCNVKVQAPAKLTGLRIDSDVLHIFDFVPGKYCAYRVIGTYADKVDRTLNAVDFPMHCDTTDPKIATADLLRNPKLQEVSRIVRGASFGTTTLKIEHEGLRAEAKVIYQQQ